MNFDDRAEANTSAEQYKDQEQNKFQRDNKDKQGMPGPNMSLAYRDDEIERQNFSNEATLRWVNNADSTVDDAAACDTCYCCIPSMSSTCTIASRQGLMLLICCVRPNASDMLCEVANLSHCGIGQSAWKACSLLPLVLSCVTCTGMCCLQVCS